MDVDTILCWLLIAGIVAIPIVIALPAPKTKSSGLYWDSLDAETKKSYIDAAIEDIQKGVRLAKYAKLAENRAKLKTIRENNSG